MLIKFHLSKVSFIYDKKGKIKFVSFNPFSLTNWGYSLMLSGLLKVEQKLIVPAVSS